MNILVTGAKGFVGKNLISELHKQKYTNIYEYDIDTEHSLLETYCKEADFVFHLAGINRPKEQSEFMEGNFGFTSTLLNVLKKNSNKCPVMISSSTQASLDNPYGRSKKAGEDLMFTYGKETGAKVLVYRFPNVFGKWCRPNYNSAVATFCYNVAHDLPIQVNDPKSMLNLVYIDDVIEELMYALNNKENKVDYYCAVPVIHTVSLGEIVELIQSFKESRKTLLIPNMANAV